MSQYQFLNLKITFKLIDKKDAKTVNNERKKKAENLSISLGTFQDFFKVSFKVFLVD